jgi:hypothetical protein
MNDCSCCECCHSPMDHWDVRQDVPQSGWTNLQNAIEYFIPQMKGDRRLMQVYVGVRFIGEPPRMHGGGVYEVTHALGYEFLIGRRFGIGYSSIHGKV